MSSGVRRAFVAEDVGCRDAFELIAVCAQHVPACRFAISVTNPYLRSPGSLVASMAALRQLLAVPVTLGLGSSSRGIIHGQLGMHYGDPVEVMRATVTAIRAGVSDLHSGMEIGLMLAAMGPRMLRLAGEVADEVMLNTGTTPRYVRWARERIAEGASAAGRNPAAVSIAVWAPVYVGAEPRSERLERARRWAASMLSIPRQGELLLRHAGLDASFLPRLRAVHGAYPHSGDVAAGAGLIPAGVVETLAIVGTPTEAVTRLRQFVDAGVDTIVIGPRSLGAIAGAW